ncbi:MAG: hypothetical protein RIR16_658 [Actinomycetota bacterium]|jgi:hypothetical protein
MLQISNNVVVSLNRNGEPIGFVCQNQRYQVKQKPRRWFGRKEWWQELTGAAKGIGASAIELTIWQVVAQSSTGEIEKFELIHDEWAGRWLGVSLNQ